jgi:hypothetical protein
MSGGYFEYAQYRISDIAFMLKELIAVNQYEYKPETLDKFKYTLRLLMRAQVAVQRIDWLVSCDDSEDTFHERWEEDMSEIKNILESLQCLKSEDE